MIEVFYITITSTELNRFVFIVYTPYILASILMFLVSSKCCIIDSSILIKFDFSFPLNVFTISLLSYEKKKKDPLFPAPCPALKTLFLLNDGFKESFISLEVIPSNFMIY